MINFEYTSSTRQCGGLKTSKDIFESDDIILTKEDKHK